VFISKDVLTRGDESTEFVIQFTGVSHDARKLRNDDAVDALAYCLSDVGSVLAADEAEFVGAALAVNPERLRNLPLRACALNDEEIDTLSMADENEIALREKLDALLDIQRREIAEGINDPALQRRIDAISADLAKLRGGYARRLGHIGKWNFTDEDRDNA
jgi:hypothetical protein